jgi:hypothetical protein
MACDSVRCPIFRYRCDEPYCRQRHCYYRRWVKSAGDLRKEDIEGVMEFFEIGYFEALRMLNHPEQYRPCRARQRAQPAAATNP